jgi:HPt (histidine-containing phosphotransfer) domain-containing protein
VEVVAGSAAAAGAPPVATPPPADPVAPGVRFLEEADEEPVLDEARLSISSMNSTELRSVLLQAFQTHARPRLNRLRERAAAGDAHGVEFEAHGLKGMCATLGAARCASLFGRMERLGREQRLEPVAPMVERADIEVGRVEALIAPPSKAA